MKLTRSVHRAGLCLALTLPPALLAQAQKPAVKTPAKAAAAAPAQNSAKTARSTTPAAATAGKNPVASAGAVVVKDWESGGGLRAPVASDFPPSTNNNARLRTGAPVVTPVPVGGGIEIIDPVGLQSTMIVTRDANGALRYSCDEPGDHSKHAHAKPALNKPMQTPKPVEVQ